MTDLGRVAILAGGLSHERDVSVRSGRRVAEAMAGVGVEVSVLDLDAGLLERLRADPPAVVIPLVHGAAGEDGSIRDVLELLGLPYVGARPGACRVTFDKPVAQAVLAAAGLDVPDSVALPHATFRELGANAILAAAVTRLGLPLVVKPGRSGSALGMTIVHEPDELAAGMVGAFAYDDTAMLERFVAGTEVAVAVVDTGAGPVALPAVEIVPDGGAYDYAARYTAGTTEFFTPARLEGPVSDAVAEAAVRVHRALGLRDFSRVDIIVDSGGRPWVLEANVAPGVTETSLLPQAAAAAGLELGLLFRDLAAHAQQRDQNSQMG